MTIIRAEGEGGTSPSNHVRAAFAGFGLVLGLALLVMAVPRSIAAWEARPADTALEKFTKASPAELHQGIAGLERSVTWIASGRRLTDLGTLELLLSEALAPNDPGRGPLLRSAESHLMAGLAANPLDGLDWYRLAEVRAARGDDRRAIVEALVTSLDLAPNMRGLWIDRTMALLRDRKYLTADETAAANSQLRRIWRADPVFREQLVQALRDNTDSLDGVRQALDGDREALEQLRQLKK